METDKFKVIRDTSEKQGFGWWFREDDRCDGTIVQNLNTGDYTIKGAEDIFVIERKRNTGEFAINIFEDRFYRELERLDSFEHPFMILEFTMDDMVHFPRNSGVPQNKWSKLKVTPKLMIKKFLEISCNYKTKIILAGDYGMPIAFSLFKRIKEIEQKNT